MSWELGISGPPTSANSSNVAAIAIVAKNKLSAYEAVYSKSILLSDSTIDSLKAESLKWNIALSMHGVYYTSVLNNPAYSMDKVFKYVGQSLLVAKEVGCPIIIHPGASYKGDIKEQLSLVTSRLNLIIKETGCDNIYLETSGKVNSFGQFAELVSIYYELGTRICVDFAHEWAKSAITNKAIYFESKVETIISTLEDFPWKDSVHFHLSGMELSKGGEGYHLPLTSNTVPWKMILNKLLQSQLGGRIILESSKYNEEDSKMILKYMEEG